MQVSEPEVLERWGIDADIQIVFVHAGVPSGKQPWACDKIYQKGQLCTSKCDSVVRCLLRNVNSHFKLHFWLISGGYFTRKSDELNMLWTLQLAQTKEYIYKEGFSIPPLRWPQEALTQPLSAYSVGSYTDGQVL